MEQERITSISLEEENEIRLVTNEPLTGTIEINNTERLETNGTEWLRLDVNGPRWTIGEVNLEVVIPETQPVTQLNTSVPRDFADIESLYPSESLETGSIDILERLRLERLINSETIQGVESNISTGIPLGYRLGIERKKYMKQKTSIPVVTPTDDPNIFNVDWGLNKYLLSEFSEQKKYLFNSDDINTIKKHAIISINNKETVNLLESTDNSLMLLREYIPQNIKRDIDNNINVPSLLFGVQPKYVSQFTLEYISDVGPKPHNWEYIRKNVYKRNYGKGDTGFNDFIYSRTVASDINENKSNYILKDLLGILGFVKFSSYLSSVRDPEEFTKAAAQMGMNEDDILKKTRGFKELFILKLTEFDYRGLWKIRYFSKRPNGVIELNTKDMWSYNNRFKDYRIATVYL